MSILELRHEPDEGNGYHAGHAELLVSSFERVTGRALFDWAGGSIGLAQALYEAPFFVASHNTEADPILNYGNRVAQNLFEMTWEEFTQTPSRFTAEVPVREERQRLLRRVTESGFIDDYSGVRISKSGRRFRIERATVWNLLATDGSHLGQAATFSEWHPL